MQNECFICGGNDFTVTDGAFVCNECGIQSQVSTYDILQQILILCTSFLNVII